MTVIQKRFDNGLTLIAQAMHEAPVVAVQAWVRVGSGDEAPEQAGIAHLHEHMLFKGTELRGPGEVARVIEAAGGEINAWTSYDQTVYHVVVAKDDIGVGLEVLHDMLFNSTFDGGELGREIEVVVEEIRRAMDAPSRRLSTALFDLAYQKHPYGRPVLGTENTVRALSREQILGFYRENYRPDAITLVVTGDFVESELVRSIESLYSGRSAAVKLVRKARPVEPEQKQVRVKVLREEVNEARFSVAFPIPGLHHEDCVALDVLSIILGHGESSRLHQKLYREEQTVSDVYSYAYTPQDPGLLFLGAGLRPNCAAPALRSLLLQSYRLRYELVSEDELEKAKVLILSEAAYQRETVQGQARRLGYYEVVAGDYAYVESYERRLRELNAGDVQIAARKYLSACPNVVLQCAQKADSRGYELIDDAALSDIVEQSYDVAVKNEGLESPNLQARKPLPAPLKSTSAAGSQELTRIELENGAILLLQEENTPVVAFRAVALGGLRWENEQNAGLGHLLASVWGAATQRYSHLELAQKVALAGGSLSAFCGRNSLGLRGEFVAEKAHEGLALFSEALVTPLFSEQEMRREQQSILQQLHARKDSAAAVAFDHFVKTLYPTHPYGLPSSGREESVGALQLSDVTDCYKRFAAADKLVVAVSGGFRVDQMVHSLREILHKERGPALPRTAVMEAAPGRNTQRFTLDKEQTHILVGARGTTLFSDDRYALEVLTTVLSGQSGRLFMDLRDKQSLAYSVSASSVEGLDPGYIVVHMATSPQKVEAALLGIYRHLTLLREELILESELKRARRYLIGTHAIELQRCGARAMAMAMGERLGLGHDSYKRYAAKVGAVDAEKVREVARRYLSAEFLLEVAVGR